MNKEFLINEQIREKEVRLIGSDGEQLGVVNTKEALQLAEDKVEVTVRFTGREADYSYKGNSILDLFVSKIEDVCAVEKAAKLEGRNMIMILAPKRA